MNSAKSRRLVGVVAIILLATPLAITARIPLSAQTETATPTASPAIEEEAKAATEPPSQEDALLLYDDNGNGRITCAEARNHGIAPVPAGHPAYQYMRDADDDGIVCEVEVESRSERTSFTLEAEESDCFRADGGHDRLEEQIKAILGEPVEFENTYISLLDATLTEQNGNTLEIVKTGITPVYFILKVGDRSMMAWGIAGTEDIVTTENKPVECESEILGIVEFTLGEAIYFSEAVPPTTPTPDPTSTSTPVLATATTVATSTP